MVCILVAGDGIDFSEGRDMSMKTLYCYKFDDITGDVTRIAIHEYKEMELSGKSFYRFETEEIVPSAKIFFIDKNKLDRFCSGKVYSFHDDVIHARKIIFEKLLGDRQEAERKAKRCSYLIHKMERSAADEHTNGES